MRIGEKKLAVATGFAMQSSNGPVLVTNWHDVTGLNPHTGQPLSPTGAVPDQLLIVHNRAGHLGEWVGRIEPLFHDGHVLWHEHPTLGSKADIVVLPLTALDDVELYPYDIAYGPSIKLGPADAVSVVGFPFGLAAGGSFAVWATGFVASEPAIDFNELPTMLIDCRTRPGQSGSAVIFHRSGGSYPKSDGGTALFTGTLSKFLGIYSGRINSESDIGIVWKASAVAELVASVT